MPRGTPFTIRCPKCRRGKWNYPPEVKGCRATGRVESRVTISKHSGHGSGGNSFYGWRGEVECQDCGHVWFSTHPLSGRVRWRSELADPGKPTTDVAGAAAGARSVVLTWQRGQWATSRGVDGNVGWLSSDGRYFVWVQARPRHEPPYYAAARLTGGPWGAEERPWLCGARGGGGTFAEAKRCCQEDAARRGGNPHRPTPSDWHPRDH